MIVFSSTLQNRFKSCIIPTDYLVGIIKNDCTHTMGNPKSRLRGTADS